uniref:Zinc finger CHCC-type domain-containing protein n=1 Tax=Timema bartmani TaxID=61472 RepID=A0A7R9F0J4_9NEOP|nr:unnamed protein product [Timema bartmani]
MVVKQVGPLEKVEYRIGPDLESCKVRSRRERQLKGTPQMKSANFVLFQQWEKDDYRLARFIDRPKQINTQFAIDLIAAVPPMPTKERVICCDGGGGPTGHPKVFINLDKPGNHSCGYCGLRFFKEGHDH